MFIAVGLSEQMSFYSIFKNDGRWRFLLSSSSEFHAEGQQPRRNYFRTFIWILARLSGYVLLSKVLSTTGPQRCWCKIVECMSAPVHTVPYIPTGNICTSLSDEHAASSLPLRNGVTFSYFPYLYILFGWYSQNKIWEIKITIYICNRIS